MVSLYDLYLCIIRRNIILLKECGIKISEKRYLLAIVLSTIIPLILKYFLNLTLKSFMILLIMYLLTTFLLPRIIYDIKIERFERNLPKALYVMVLALESGRSVVDAINEVIESNIREVDIVFLKIVKLIVDKKLSFEDAVLLVSASMDSKIFRLVGRLLIENRKYGGELAKTLATLAKTLEDLQNLRSQLLSVTANGLAVGLIILCGVVPATAGIIGSYLNITATLVPGRTPVTPEEIAKCMEIIQIGTGIFGMLFTIPLFGLKFSRMVVGGTICMTFGILSFYITFNMTKFLFS
ncbi:type II secretion system F family protein [Methanofervidicoccus abyssi]|uniref:Archaeal flagellar protein FlaJ n=1 Tax=Methanofervidicoccus abyssi TaxID=2082189 RepID=A0A401HQP2_9EURY|nr:type II secretion system F family protein [Methanofervidicoccus abyssi]GBF36587.1 archaeal flagellar protein FlaJ [Methanofervidicoccus abyssi]